MVSTGVSAPTMYVLDVRMYVCMSTILSETLHAVRFRRTYVRVSTDGNKEGNIYGLIFFLHN